MMSTLRKISIAFAGVAVSVLAISLLSPSSGYSQGGRPEQAPAPAQDVRVVNSPSDPMPMMAQGTTAISGSVMIADMPGVHIANTPTVQVANSPTSPVWVRDLDTTRQPFHRSVSLLLEDGDITTQSTFMVPAGKRLVIEYVSGEVVMPAGQTPRGLHLLPITYTENGFVERIAYRIPLQAQGRFTYWGDERDTFTASQRIVLYAEPETDVVIYLTRFGSGTAGRVHLYMGISGYLVDVS
jgi:hypothetical protein